MEKWTRVPISCVIMYVTSGGEGVKKSEIFMDVIDGSPLTGLNNGARICHATKFYLITSS